MKIRIGTDLHLLVTISSIVTGKSIGIRSIEAYLVNATIKSKVDEDLKKKTKFISRFPIEPMRDSYISTNYNINCSGYPNYYVWPEKHVMSTYAGFGYNPNWDMIYPNFPHHRLTEYKAPVIATKLLNLVEIHFPAEDQLFCGDYNIILVVKYYAPGYTNMTKTVTIDYNNAFTLVDNSEEEDFIGDERISIKNIEDIPNYEEGSGTDIYVYKGTLNDDNINLDLTNGDSVNVDISGISSWHNEY